MLEEASRDPQSPEGSSDWDHQPLDDLRCRIARSLFCLEDWARWRNREYSDEDAVLAVEDRFTYGHMGKTSADGWAYIEADLSEDYEQEYQEMKVNRLGHVFTYSRSDF